MNNLNDYYCVLCDGIVTIELVDLMGVCPFCDDVLVVFPENDLVGA